MEGVLCGPISGIFLNQDHLQYYHSSSSSSYRSKYHAHPVGVRCGVVGGRNIDSIVVMKKDSVTSTRVDDKKMTKKMRKKKRSKLLKGLSDDLAMLLSSGGLGLDSPQNRGFKDASEAFLSQLNRLQSEHKELKKKIKEEKAKLRASDRSVKKTKPNYKASNCSFSSSSSSSESSDSEDCEKKVLDRSPFKHGTYAAPPSSEQEKAAPTLAHLANTQNLAIPSEQGSDNILLSFLEKEEDATEKKKKKKRVEVCMGGKCKRSGGGALLDEFQKVAGATATGVEVVGCKCMGKCKDGPNVRLVSPPPIDIPRVSYPLCIGVGLEDVGFIVSKFAGDEVAV